MSNKIILVPINFSEQSIIAIEQSYNLAKFTDSELTLLYVDNGTIPDAKDKLEKISREASAKSGVKINTTVAKGNVYKEIIKVAKILNPTMVIMGFNSSPKIRNIGTNSFRVLKELACPVITIKGKKHKDGCKNIVLPLDITEQTREKVKVAIEFAKFFDATIRVISVRTPNELRHENKLIAYSHQVQKYIKSKKINCTIKTLEGNPISKLVVDYATEVDADLIMIVSKTSLSIKELFSGTIAQEVVNISDIPVLSVRPLTKAYSKVGVGF